MNWLDIVLLVILLFSIVTSIAKGLSGEIVGLISLFAALLLGIWFYAMAGAVVQPYVSSRGVANFCGFLMVFFGVLIVGGLIGHLVRRMLRVAGLSFLDRLLGAAFGFVRGMVVAIALVMALMAFTPGASADSPPQSVVHSRIAPYVVDAARIASAVAPHELREGFRKTYAQVKNIWDRTLTKGIRDLPNKKKANNEREI